MPASTSLNAGEREDLHQVSVCGVPGLERLAMARPAALHLYRLLQRYNWCLQDSAQYVWRWAEFWPRISVIERKVLRLVVCAHCNGRFGLRLRAMNMPVDFEPFEGNVKPVVMTENVAREFRRVLSSHYARLVTANEIRQRWTHRRPDEYALVSARGIVEELLEDERGLHPDLVHERCKQALVGDGMRVEDAEKVAGALSIDLEWFFQCREQMLC